MPAPFSRLPSDSRVRIGHNGGPPLDTGTRWRTQCWTVARRALVGHVPLEVVRMRIRRARELGLSYPAYASILTGTGRDVVAFLFTAEALGLRLRRGARLAEIPAERLRGLSGCDRLLLAPAGSDPRQVARELALAERILFAEAGAAPAEPATLPEGRAAVARLLAPRALPRDAVVMVGARAEERDWAEAARLAKFLAATAYFEPLPA